uniref:Uncharacterized protein n=1 Tax=Sphaeramia orbicularis TaxID=375764 RepID=A0A672ZS57_9TELE
MTVLGLDFCGLHYGHGGLENHFHRRHGGLLHHQVAGYWSSLWRSCFTDSTAVSNMTYPIVRGLLMAALSLGMLGFVLSMLGMECTFIGGWCHIISGVLSTCGYGVYAQYVSVEYFNPDFTDLKFDLGTPLFLGWVGSGFHMAGGFFYLWSVCKPLCGGETTKRGAHVHCGYTPYSYCSQQTILWCFNSFSCVLKGSSWQGGGLNGMEGRDHEADPAGFEEGPPAAACRCP